MGQCGMIRIGNKFRTLFGLRITSDTLKPYNHCSGEYCNPTHVRPLHACPVAYCTSVCTHSRAFGSMVTVRTIRKVQVSVVELLEHHAMRRNSPTSDCLVPRCGGVLWAVVTYQMA